MSVNTHPDVAPPYLYIPVWLDEEGIVQISIADGAQKEKILLAYTALDRLLDALGDKQPWATIPTSKLSTLKEETGYTHLVVDYYVSNIVRKISEYEGWPKGQHRRVPNRTQTNLYNRSGRIGPLGSHHATGNRRRNRNIHHYRYAWRTFNGCQHLTTLLGDTRDELQRQIGPSNKTRQVELQRSRISTSRHKHDGSSINRYSDLRKSR